MMKLYQYSFFHENGMILLKLSDFLLIKLLHPIDQTLINIEIALKLCELHLF